MSDGGTCTGFEPQNYLRDRCKKCFRLKSKHEEPNNNHSSPSGNNSQNARTRRPVSVASAIGSPEATPTNASKKEKRRSWREKNNPDEGPDNDLPDTSDTVSMVSFKSANSKGLSSAKSAESLNSTNDARSMVTAISGESFEKDHDEDRALTPTESEYTNDHLRSEIRLLQEEVSKLKEERRRLTQTPVVNGKDGSVVEQLKQRLIDAENLIQDYRDENTVLKCELRDIQIPAQNPNFEEKLKNTENLCEELMLENESLKSDIRDLQQEIEEMQDQYREEEIEEFRELQRELEQNAKNCRILQFKLRKSERQKDQLEAEKEHFLQKLKELNKSDSGSIEFRKEKELESELRIAKEVSVRLHNELEAAEEKRCKLEDEIFYYKEKCRELQTQNKWREARNKAEQAAKRHSQELVEGAPLPEGELHKELRDVLERENDLREQLKFTEEDLKRCRTKINELESENEELLQKLVKMTETVGRTSGGKRPPMTRSASEGHGLLSESEMDRLSTKCKDLEKKNTSLTKKMLEMEIDLAKKLNEKSETGSQLNAEMEKDLSRMMSTIHELEKKNTELNIQLKKMENAPGNLKVTSAPSSPIIGREKNLQVELRTEQDKRKELETEIAEYKSLIAKSENQKLIAMATKVELLQNQLTLANDRINCLHKKVLKEAKEDEIKYADSLKIRCEKLEKQLSEIEANRTFPKKSESPTDDEIEQCCVVLASVEAQTNRLCKQMEKLDTTGQKERRRSLSAENSATIVAELANIQEELQNVKQLMESQKLANPVKEKVKSKEVIKEVMTGQECSNCSQKSKEIDQLKEEITFYKKKNKELTNQVLQTEDRWSREIEKQTHVLRTQIHSLDAKLAEIQSKFEEQGQLLNSTTNQLMEKKRTLEEEKEKNIRLQVQLEDTQKELQQMEKDQHGLKEWEIKYKKLEKLFDQEKEKFDSDRTKIKSDTALLKKRTDEAVADLEKLRNSHQKREIMWNEERQNLQKEMQELKSKLGEKSEEESGVRIPIQKINYKSVKTHGEGISELTVKLTALEKRNEELEAKVVDLRIQKEGMESELIRKKISFERERESMLHKVRQDGKIKVVEIDALQQKFASRMSIMENTNKSLHSQLVQTRRERDHHREAVSNYEKKIEQEQKINKELNKKIQELSSRSQGAEKRIQELEAEVHRLTVELSLSKDAHKADKKLWKIEKSHFEKSSTPSGGESGEERDRRITEDALRAAESVQKQYSEYQQLYASEVNRLNSKIKELQNEIIHKQFETDKIIKELQEQIKIMEIDQRNLVQAKEMQSNAREILQADQERLLQIVQQTEIQKLTRKYKFTALIEQLNNIQDKNKNDGIISTIIQQLNFIKNEDCKNFFTSNDVSDFESPTDFSSSNLSIKSIPYQSQLVPRQKNLSSYSLMTQNQRSFSIDSNSAWDGRSMNYEIGRSRSPQRITNYPDPPPNFLLSKDRIPEYDKDGRLHYIPKNIARSASYDRYGTVMADYPSEMSASLAQIQTKSTGTWTEDDGDTSVASKTGSTGTNILYKIRREELSKGTGPSVKSIAKAFESMDPRTLKRGLFSIRKSRSVDTHEQSRSSKHNTPGGTLLRAVTPLNRNTTSMSQIELGDRQAFHNPPPVGPNSGNLTLPRGGRNPFKNMGARIVDRVRRSLSRSRRPSEERKDEAVQNLEPSQVVPVVPTSPPPPMPPSYVEQNDRRKDENSTTVKTKKIVVKKKVPGSAPKA